MAIALTSQLTDVVLDPGSPTSLGTGNAQASETVIQLQGANCAAIGHAGSVGPVSGPTVANLRGCTDAGNNVVRTDTHIHIWFRDLYPVRNVAVGGCCLYLLGGSAALYFATGLDKGYVGGWFHYILNLDPGDRPAASVGTAPTGNITSIGYEGNISATKGEAFLQNCYFDAIRSGTGGQGITFTGGTSGARELFATCANADTARYGLFRNVGGAYFIEGPITFGAATLTTYIQEALQTLNFTDFTVNNGAGGTTVVPAVAADYYRIVLADGTTGVTNIDFTDITFKGVSRAVPFRFTANLAAGDAYVSVRSTYLFGEIITLNTLCSSQSDNFIECQTVIPGGIALLSPAFSHCDAVTLTATNDAITGGATNTHNTAINVPFITTNSLNKITKHAFNNTGGTGHAVLINTAGSYNWDGNTLVGYGGTPGSNLVASSGDSSAAIYNNSGGAVTITVINGGNSPSVRNGAGATTTVIAGAVTVTVKCVTQLGVAIANVRVRVEAKTPTGPLADGTVIISGLTNGSGEISDTRTYASAQDIVGVARKSSPGDVPLYQQGDIIGTVNSASGLAVTVVMIPDE